jgi:hypothetical protein
MRKLLVIIFALIALYILYSMMRPTREGFKSMPYVRQGNYVLDLVGRLKKTTKTLADPQLWRDRMALIGKSPMDLAREQIRKEAALRRRSVV